MPRNRPPTSGYARLSQADEEEAYQSPDDYDQDDPHARQRTVSQSSTQYAAIQPGPRGAIHLSDGSPNSRRRPDGHRRKGRSNSSVDIKAINARLEKWAQEIASTLKIKRIKGKSHAEEKLEIHHTVFQAPDGVLPLSSEALQAQFAVQEPGRMTKDEFEHIVDSVQTAIELGMHPKMISKGSSGSYFARNTDGKVVGVFKPKDEEPYATRNPKWTKWIHRNLFPCFFGRACLIPNLSYVSEAAAYTLDCRLRTNIVPYTDIVHLSSKAFYYDFWERSAFYRKRKPLPLKPGSFQVFLKGYKDATEFFRTNPWPDQVNSGFRPQDAPKSRRRPWTENCRATLLREDEDEDDEDGEDGEGHANRPISSDGPWQPKFRWTPKVQQTFREELEKLVILDYIMRNTDRGLDNWMIKVDWGTEEVSIVSEPPSFNTNVSEEEPARPIHGDLLQDPYKRQQAMDSRNRSVSPGLKTPRTAPMPTSMQIGAIDNSLSWPWKHPDAWRSFPFGWLFLPVSLIGQPFSQKTRDHFIPLLTSKEWWSDTQVALRKVFEQDADFKDRMFARQIATMKGQAWNVVETLKQPDHGPLELTRRTRVCVWDDLVDVPIAIPLRSPSNEMRRQQQGESSSAAIDEDEMDIGAIQRPNGFRPRDDLMKFDTSKSLPSPHRFDLSRNDSANDIFDDPGTPATVAGDYTFSKPDPKDFINGTAMRNGRPSNNRVSFDQEPLRATKARRFSATSRGSLYDSDDAEGDLGYVAAAVTEKHTRKVIVERLEAVKSKNPVFTWC